MDPVTGAMLASAGSNIIGGMMAGGAAADAAKDAARIQEQNYLRNKELLESVGIPSIEAQKILLTNPEKAQEIIAEQLGSSALENISLDPQLRRNQMEALSQLKNISEDGLDIRDRINFDQALEEVAGQDQGRQQAILQGMAERGNLDSGAQLAMQMQSAGDSNRNALDNARALLEASQSGRMNALQQMAQMSGQLEDTDFRRQTQLAGAQDQIAQFNAQQRAQTGLTNTQMNQNYFNQLAANANQQEMYNKGLIQQDYLNRLDRAKSITGMNSQNAQNQANAAMTAGQGQAQMYSGIGSAIGNIASAYGSHMSQQQNKGKDPSKETSYDF